MLQVPLKKCMSLPMLGTDIMYVGHFESFSFPCAIKLGAKKDLNLKGSRQEQIWLSTNKVTNYKHSSPWTYLSKRKKKQWFFKLDFALVRLISCSCCLEGANNMKHGVIRNKNLGNLENLPWLSLYCQLNAILLIYNPHFY